MNAARYEEQRIRNVILEIYEARSTEARVSPLSLAQEAVSRVRGEDLATSYPEMYVGAHLYFRQVARSICRQHFESEEQSDTHPLFPGLQSRYPAAHKTGLIPEYVLLEHLSKEDVEYNVQRLRNEAQAKSDHADALKAWWDNRAG